MKIIMVGAGRVGGSLARWFTDSGVEVELWDKVSEHGPPSVEGAALVVLAVPEEDIASAARAVEGWGVRAEVPFVHCSGVAHPAGFAPTPRPQGAMHPAYSFSSPDTARSDAACFLLDGDEVAVAAARRVLDAAGLAHMRGRSHDRKLYHAGCVTASNFVGLLGVAAGTMMEKAGLPPEGARKLLLSLLAGVVENAADAGFEEALSGPVVRGDADTVLAEADRLAEYAPELLPLFLEGNRSLAVVLDKPEVAKAIMEWARSFDVAQDDIC